MRAARRKHVHLGDRLDAIEQVRNGRAMADVAREAGVSVEELAQWQQLHAGDRTVSLSEIRRPQSEDEARLALRIQRLAKLVGDADRELRGLHEEYIRGLAASNELFEASNEAFDDEPGPSKKFG